MRLLLVEDDHILGSSLTKALEKHAYGVDWLQDGESALAALSDCAFAAVILDINLPKMNGLDVLKKLTEMDGQARVIVVSADVQDSSRVLAESGGAAGFLTKPVDRATLLSAVSKTLETGTAWS